MAGWDNEFEAERPRYDHAHGPGEPPEYRPPIEPRPPAPEPGREGAGPPPQGQGGDRRHRPPRRRQGQGQNHGPGHQGQGHGRPHPQNHGHGPRPGWEGPVGFAQKVAREFSDGVRSRGQSYFLKNRVAISASSPGEVVARVKGTAKYRVRLRLRGDKLVATCSCPYFSPFGDACKHLWATILAADARGLLPGASVPMRPLRLVTDVPQKQRPQGPDAGLGPLALPLPTDSPGNGPPPPPRDGRFPNDGRRPAPGSYRTSYGPGPVQGPGYGIHGPAPAPNGARGRKDNRKEKGRRPARAGGAPGEPVAGSYAQGIVPGRINQRAAKQPAKVVRNTKRMLAYILDIPATLAANQVVIELARRLRKPNGDWSELKVWRHSGTPTLAQHRYDPEDEDLLTLLTRSSAPPPGQVNGQGDLPGASRFTLLPERQAEVVEALARTERLRLRRAGGEEKPPTLKWVPATWRFGIDVKPEPPGKRWTWRGILRRRVNGEDQKIDLNEPLALLHGLVILGNGRAAPFDDAGIFLWMMRIRHEKEMVFNDSAEMDRKLSQILSEAKVGPAQLIDSLKLAEIAGAPRPSLTLRTPRQSWGDKLSGELEFIYASEADGEARRVTVPAVWNGALQVMSEQGVVVHRDEATESAAAMKLFEMGFRETKDHLLPAGTLELPAKRLAAVTKELVALGWKVEAEGSIIHPASEFKLAVTTGIDWFELGGAVDFGGQSVPLPDLLAAARRGETMIELGDGSMGMLPEEWLKKYGMLADLGTSDEGGIRFGRAQAGLLDALIAAQPEIKVDMAFGKVRKALPQFEGLQAREAPAGFRGELRPYQREGLGWLDYLQKFEFGGILADDMGLGKTVQVLAHLQSRRARRQAKGPSLIVVPRSLVFNWMQEAERFTPRLRVLDYTGPGRQALRESFDEYDLIITTYGTMRTDIADLCQREFDYVILDEAQAIKNADSQSAKAARLLKGNHRLAMTGTPIENHLGELWSIFEFLNPGMLGTAGVFKRHTSGSAASDDSSRGLLARALRPFILRRTKAQVVQDLPDKLEQTLYCDMEPAQRKTYEELRAHYRTALLRKGEADLNRSKIEVLEALLRLRQASCHPGLIDPSRAADPSAKLEMLLPQLAEVVDEGHKVLIFSQFTSFLALVRERLDAEGIAYEYLDGRTRDRAARVERFQSDPEVPVFLISLKAGGLGLNLTAADYVYLLDPWWNPAVEAQAIDRSHRIGQTQRVFAYRLICRDTVEQKILELQQKKRDLADAILNADNQGMIAGLTRDDLEFLLS